MSYSLAHDEQHGIAMISFASPGNINEHVSGKTEAVEFCHHKHCHKLLVDLFAVNAIEDFNKAELLTFSEHNSIGHEAFEKELIVAIVMPEGTEDQDQMYFLLNMMKMNCLKITSFYQKEKALEWLEKVIH